MSLDLKALDEIIKSATGSALHEVLSPILEDEKKKQRDMSKRLKELEAEDDKEEGLEEAEDEGDEGLHANFKLSKGGEIISLIKDNTIVDQIEFGPQISEVSSGRLTGHTGKLENLSPTPGASNRTYK